MVEKHVLTAFRNHVMCRHEYNQIQARKIYEEFKDKIPDDFRNEFEIDWAHFKTGELPIRAFGSALKILEQKI